MGFGASVRSKRQEHGFTLEQLAERAEITPNYLGRIENEKVDPSLSVVLAIAAALAVTVGELVDSRFALPSKRRPASRTYPDALEIAKLLESLPLDVRETLLPALSTVVARINPPKRRRRSSPRRAR
jgi:transcriptional regulator with XRE-family HTH domain